MERPRASRRKPLRPSSIREADVACPRALRCVRPRCRAHRPSARARPRDAPSAGARRSARCRRPPRHRHGSELARQRVRLCMHYVVCLTAPKSIARFLRHLGEPTDQSQGPRLRDAKPPWEPNRNPLPEGHRTSGRPSVGDQRTQPSSSTRSSRLHGYPGPTLVQGPENDPTT